MSTYIHVASFESILYEYARVLVGSKWEGYVRKVEIWVVDCADDVILLMFVRIIKKMKLLCGGQVMMRRPGFRHVIPGSWRRGL